MRKRLRIGLVLVVLIGLVACSAKPEEIKLNLGSVVFVSIYNGPGTNIADSKIGKLNSEEAVSLRESLKINQWIVADSSSKTKTEPEFVLEDDLGHLFSFYQENDFVLIEVSKEKLDSIYYKAETDLTSLKTQTLIPLINGYQLKEAIKRFFFSNVVPDNMKYGCYSSLVLDKPSSDTLKNVFSVDSWILIDTNLTELGSYEMILGFNSAVELYFHQTESDATVAISRNGDRSRYYVFQTTKQVYDAVKSTLTEIRHTLQPAPGSLVGDSVYTDAEFNLFSNYYEPPVPFNLVLSDADNAWAKPFLNSDSWIKLDPSLTLKESEYRLTLTDTQGTHLTFGMVEGCPAVMITKENDAQFKETYGVPEGLNGIIWAFSHSWTQAKPQPEILSVKPDTIKILKGYSELGDPQFKTVILTDDQSTTLMDVLNRDQWRKDPDPTQYAYGWDALCIFEDSKGNIFQIYDDSGRNSTLIFVRGPMAGSNDSLFYLTSYQTVLDLKATLALLFPN